MFNRKIIDLEFLFWVVYVKIGREVFLFEYDFGKFGNVLVFLVYWGNILMV